MINILRTLKILSLAWVLGCFLSSPPSHAGQKRLGILPSTAQSNLKLAAPLREALGRVFKETGHFEVFRAPQPLPSFSPSEISKVMEEQNCELLSFVFLEQARLSIFLFDKDHDSQFLVSSRPLSDFSGTKIDFPFVETRFREAFTEVMRLYHEEQYQPLPGSQSEPPQVATNTSFANRPDPRLAAESRALFRELSSQTDSSFRLGAQIGMARFSSQGTTASNVAFGLAAGYDLFPRFSLEAGFSLASYLMAQGGIRYLLPFAEKQVKLSIGVEVANVISPISQNVGYVSQGFSYESPPIPRGSFFAGPGIFFEIPLLGAGLRGDLRMYFGNGTILMGTYGFVYHI